MTKFFIGADEWPGLSKLNEECGELVQVIGKLIATDGDVNHWEGGFPLDKRLEAEIADVIASAIFVCDANRHRLDDDRISERIEQKLALFHKWHNEQQAEGAA